MTSLNIARCFKMRDVIARLQYMAHVTQQSCGSCLRFVPLCRFNELLRTLPDLTEHWLGFCSSCCGRVQTHHKIPPMHSKIPLRAHYE
jgi:hypothetical protein